MIRLNEDSWLDRRNSKRWISKFRYNRIRFYSDDPLTTINNIIPLIGILILSSYILDAFKK